MANDSGVAIHDQFTGGAALTKLLPKHCPVAAAGIPVLNQVGDKGFQYSGLTKHARLPFGKGWRTKKLAHRAALQPQFSANRSKRPALVVQFAYPLKAFQPRYIFEQRERALSLQVNDGGAVALAFLSGPVVEPNDFGGFRFG